MSWICGIDEAGRGPLAGPIVAAALVIPSDFDIQAIDSKKLSEKRREAWADEFQERHPQIQTAVVQISVAEINTKGIGWANKEIFRRLILQLEADIYLVDGNLKLFQGFSPHELAPFGDKVSRVQNEIKGDERIPVIAAASILAKTHRDRIMRELHQTYPQYHWDKNKGYGSAQHISAIRTFGNTLHHRQQFVATTEGKTYTRGGKVVAEQLLLLPPTTALLPFLLSQIIQYLL